MASVFRKRITSQILSILKPFLKNNDKGLIYDSLPLSLKFSQPKLLPPQFELHWKDLVNIKPELQDRIHFSTVNTYLSNQDFPTSDGFNQILVDSVTPEKLIFSVDQDLFTSSVLLNICNKIENLPDYSTFFKAIVPENIIVEYSSPNVAKPFHFGHFRSTIIGNFVANICQYVGHRVTRMNYVGDWGSQFGTLAVGFSKFGSEDKLKEDPLHHLLEVYQLANEKNDSDESFKQEAKAYFKKMEEGNVEALTLWKRLCDLSMKEIEATYEKLNVKFDVVQRESMYYNHADNVYNALLSKNLATLQDDGSLEFSPSQKEESGEKIVLRKSDGTSLYLTRDIAAAIDRKRTYNFDRMYYVVDSSQRKHFASLKRILMEMSHSWAEDLEHVPFGRILRFSTRKGSAISLSDILQEAEERTLEKMKSSETTKVTEELLESVSGTLAMSALVVSDSRGRRRRDYPFNWEDVLSMRGDSGVALQYCHARLNNLKENCGVSLYTDCEFQCLTEPEAISLIAHLSRFEEALHHAYTQLEPSALVHYLFVLKNEVGSAMKVLPVKGSSLYLARARLLLFHASHLVMKKSLELLGIRPLNKM